MFRLRPNGFVPGDCFPCTILVPFPDASNDKVGAQPIGGRSASCKPSKELICELRKRIVARAHDHDAITTPRQPDQHVAAGAAVRKSKGLSAAPLDFANNIAAADAAVDRAAEINGLGHDQHILIA
jgi:hypothetical protein